MKRLLAAMLMLVLTVALFSASAEVMTFGYSYLVDAEGNVIENEEMAQFAAATMTIDDEAMTMVFFNGQVETEYTLEELESEDTVALKATGADGEFILVCFEDESVPGIVLYINDDLGAVFMAA